MPHAHQLQKRFARALLFSLAVAREVQVQVQVQGQGQGQGRGSNSRYLAMIAFFALCQL